MSDKKNRTISSIQFLAIPMDELFRLFLPKLHVISGRGVDLTHTLSIHVSPMPTVAFLALIARQSGHNIVREGNTVTVLLKHAQV